MDERTPDDELVSAVLDGQATDEEQARVAGDPVLRARRDELAEVARQVADGVPAPSDAQRDLAVAAALAAMPTPAGAVVPLAPRRRARAALLAVAAVVALAVLVPLAALVLSGGDGGRQDGTASGPPSSTAPTTLQGNPGNAGATPSTEAQAGGAPPSTAAGSAGGGLDLGQAAGPEDLADAVRPLLPPTTLAPPPTAPATTAVPPEPPTSLTTPPTTAPPPSSTSTSTTLPPDLARCIASLQAAGVVYEEVVLVGDVEYQGDDAVAVVSTDGDEVVAVVLAPEGCTVLARIPLGGPGGTGQG